MFIIRSLFDITFLQVEVSGGLDDNSAGKIGIDDIWFTSDCQTNGILFFIEIIGLKPSMETVALYEMKFLSYFPILFGIQFGIWISCIINHIHNNPS